MKLETLCNREAKLLVDASRVAGVRLRDMQASVERGETPRRIYHSARAQVDGKHSKDRYAAMQRLRASFPNMDEREISRKLQHAVATIGAKHGDANFGDVGKIPDEEYREMPIPNTQSKRYREW